MPSPSATRRLVFAAAALLGAALTGSTRGEGWIDPHDDPEPAWELDASPGARLIARERVRLGSEGNPDDGAERLEVAAPPGQTAWFWRPVPAAAVIDELKIEVEVRTALPVVLLAAEVVLPESTGPTGAVTTLRVRTGPTSPGPGGVTKLVLDALPHRLQSEARAWRLANRGSSLELRGAYVARIGVGIPGAGRPADASVRHARVAGLVTPLRRAAEGLVTRRGEALAIDASRAVAGGVRQPTRVSLRSDGFRVDDEVFFPRMARWRGEPLATLASRGVNTLWLDEPPTPQLAADAAHRGMRLVCPPPPTPDAAGGLDRVLAWALPGKQSARSLDPGAAAVESVRGLGPEFQRPILAWVAEDIPAWARVVDGLLLDAQLVADSPPGTPTVGVVELDVDRLVAAQLDAILGDGIVPLWLPPFDVSRQVDAAISAGAAGVAYVASERLDEPDDATAAAAGWLEAVNRRLRLVEPWLTGPRSAAPTEPPGSGVLINRGGVRLAAFAPLWPAETAAVHKLPGVDEGAQAHRLSPGGLAPWPVERAVGGVSVAPPGGSAPGEVLICNDPRVLRSLQGYLAQSAPLAAARLAEVAKLRLRLSDALDPAERRLATDRLSEANLALARRAPAAAYDAAHASLAITSEAEVRRRNLARDSGWLGSSPLTVLPTTLSDAFRMHEVLASSRRGPNRLHGGSFEDLDELRRLGWRRPAAVDGSSAETPVELVSDDPTHGARAVRLHSERGNSTAAIVAPAVELAAGETVEVTGWVRVASPSGEDGSLTILDSLGGPGLALRVRETAGQWKPFHLLRATASDAPLTLRFETTGVATADIDAVMVRSVEPLGLASRPARTARSGSGQAK